jgi:hypothetical protein
MAQLFLSKQQIARLVLDTRHKLPDFKFDHIKGTEAELLLRTAESCGFEVKEDQLPAIEVPAIEKNVNAVVICRGNYTIEKKYSFETEGTSFPAKIHVIDQSLADYRLRKITKKVIEDNTVILFPGCDEEYLYEVLMDSAENELYSTLKERNINAPIYHVDFNQEGGFDVIQA